MFAILSNNIENNMKYLVFMARETDKKLLKRNVESTHARDYL